jgi:hypothetical protein
MRATALPLRGARGSTPWPALPLLPEADSETEADVHSA